MMKKYLETRRPASSSQELIPELIGTGLGYAFGVKAERKKKEAEEAERRRREDERRRRQEQSERIARHVEYSLYRVAARDSAKESERAAKRDRLAALEDELVLSADAYRQNGMRARAEHLIGRARQISGLSNYTLDRIQRIDITEAILVTQSVTRSLRYDGDASRSEELRMDYALDKVFYA